MQYKCCTVIKTNSGKGITNTFKFRVKHGQNKRFTIDNILKTQMLQNDVQFMDEHMVLFVKYFDKHMVYNCQALFTLWIA